MHVIVVLPKVASFYTIFEEYQQFKPRKIAVLRLKTTYVDV